MTKYIPSFSISNYLGKRTKQTPLKITKSIACLYQKLCVYSVYICGLIPDLYPAANVISNLL